MQKKERSKVVCITLICVLALRFKNENAGAPSFNSSQTPSLLHLNGTHKADYIHLAFGLVGFVLGLIQVLLYVVMSVKLLMQPSSTIRVPVKRHINLALNGFVLSIGLMCVATLEGNLFFTHQLNFNSYMKYLIDFFNECNHSSTGLLLCFSQQILWNLLLL